ncbi:MAG: hypothetical protein K2M87_00270 [Muribaculaceae bacterium]|nr:hypothetical protein [Muribaculaceae bacterium]
MADIRIAGVMRAGAYSPNHIGNDAAIFNAVADRLRKRGCEVRIYSEEQFQSLPIEEEIVLNMCREQESIRKLIELEEQGCLVINSGQGIENCTRERMTRILISHDVPYPESLIVNTNEDVRPALEEAGFTSCWIKRGDFHAMHKEDVSYARHPQETQEMLHEYYYRGIKRAVINRHLVGDLVKFYGVSGEPFFHWFYPFDEGHSKYGYEAVNGHSKGIPFDIEALKATCQRASDIMNVKIYGGDCIVDADGTVRIIDFNDWPSFAPCREEGAVAIAKCVLKSIREWKKR